MNANWCFISLVSVVLGSCDSHIEDPEYLSVQHNMNDVSSTVILNGRWLALGDSDFDSYQADDLMYRVNTKASNASCVLSPIEVQAKDGRDFGEYATWGDGRRQDYRANFSLSGASVRSSLFDWRAYFAEDARSGMLAFVRQLRDGFLGRESRLGHAILSELGTMKDSKTPSPAPVVVQINMGINDINGEKSLYKQFSSMDSHYSWIDARTDAIRHVVDEMLELYPGIIVVLWQLLDDGGWDTRYSSEQESRITSHTRHWNNNLQAIADARSTVIIFETDTFTRALLGRKSNGTSKDIVIDGIRYIRSFVPDSKVNAKLDNTRYVVTRDGHGNTILSALYTREVYRLLNNEFGAGIAPFTPVKINTITCQDNHPTSETPVLEIPADVTIQRTQLPYSIGKIIAHDSNGKDISDSTAAVSDRGGALYGDGQNIQLRSPRHDTGSHHVTITVIDANGLAASKAMSIVIQ